jgi:hypothetical protein
VRPLNRNAATPSFLPIRITAQIRAEEWEFGPASLRGVPAAVGDRTWTWIRWDAFSVAVGQPGRFTSFLRNLTLRQPVGRIYYRRGSIHRDVPADEPAG